MESWYVLGSRILLIAVTFMSLLYYTDLIPPSIKLTSHPPAVSRQTEWLFRFQCTGERSCTFMCSIHNINDLAQFTDCSEGQLLATNLQNNIQYELSVTALDAVGNVGLIHYQWKIGELSIVDAMAFSL